MCARICNPATARSKRLGALFGFTLGEQPAVSKRNRAAFTLVELLVVIGIIALLIAILLPALNKARQAAVDVACRSNMRQVYNAYVMYAQDNRGEVPRVYEAERGAPFAENPNNIYMGQNKYLQGMTVRPDRFSAVWVCPTQVDIVPRDPGYRGLYTFTTYYHNPHYWALSTHKTTTHKLAVPWVSRWGGKRVKPSDAAMLGEAAVSGSYLVDYAAFTVPARFGWFHGKSTLTSGMSATSIKAKDLRLNICYFDGHVGPQNAKEIRCDSADPDVATYAWDPPIPPYVP